MQWITRDYVHLDRVASPWLIKRFVDPEACFIFLPWGEEHQRPADAIPFALPGVELGAHDASGTTFQKILARYRLNEPALERMGRLIARGVDHALHHFQPAADDLDGQIAVGLLAISEGMMLIVDTDDAMIAASLPIYDALYAQLKVQSTLQQHQLSVPPPTGPGPGEKIRFLRTLLHTAGK